MATANLYGTRSGVARRLPPGALVSSMGLVASALAASNVITYDGHGFETDDPVTVRAIESGALPDPLVEGTTYYAIRLDNARFQLSATSGGAAIDLTTDGESVVVSRDPDFERHIEFYSRWADAFLPGHIVPLGVSEPVHPLVVGIVEDLAAKKLLNIAGQDSAVLNAAELASKAMLERYAAGLPLRGAPATASANRAIVAVTTADQRGWGSRCL